MIQDQSKSNSERGKDNFFYLSEEAGLTLLLAMTQSFEDCDWLVVQGGSKSAFKSRVYYKPSLLNYKRTWLFPCFLQDKIIVFKKLPSLEHFVLVVYESLNCPRCKKMHLKIITSLMKRIQI